MGLVVWIKWRMSLGVSGFNTQCSGNAAGWKVM